ncbi:hypothetical protein NMY22_g15450 [Coprinellus aureogranulatus]|nr:hypothetical protein NMY22_g15450 [Coprinellus aureogranulatus]
MIRFTASRRVLQRAPRAFSTVSVGSGVSESVQAETEDIASVSRLLTVVRQRSNPANHNVMPMRDSALWSESVLRLRDPPPSSPPSAAKKANQDEDNLEPRRMHDSYAELVLPFGTSAETLEKYINATGGIRTGKLMENLDSLAGSIAYKHMLGPNVQALPSVEDRGFYIVTASVDRLDMMAPLDPKRDVRLSGQVIYTGRSSMEVVLKMEHIGGGQEDETVMIGIYIPPFSAFWEIDVEGEMKKVGSAWRTYVLPSSDVIVTLLTQSNLDADMKQRRKLSASQSLTQVPPTSSEAEHLHSFYLQYGQDTMATLSSGSSSSSALVSTPGNEASKIVAERERVWMGDTSLSKTLLMFPQERNVHQKVFGGYLMRLAYEVRLPCFLLSFFALILISKSNSDFELSCFV